MKTTDKYQQSTALGGIWMILKDRRKLAKLMVIQEVSQRQLARAAGWRSHSYVARLVNGEVRNLETEPALRIAKFLGVGVDDLFLVRLSTKTGLTVKKDEKASSRKTAEAAS